MIPDYHKWSISEHNKRLKEILKTGKWWIYPWWLEDQYYKDGSFDKDEVKNIFEKLKKVFDARWFLGQVKAISDGNKRILTDNRIPSDFKTKLEAVSDTFEKLTLCRALVPTHPLFDEFHGSRTGALPLSNLVDLGRDLIEIRKKSIPRLNELSNRLKNKDQYSGARFELFMNANLLRLGWLISEPPPTNGKKKADLQANKGSEAVIIELKRLESSRTNKEIFEFEDWIRLSIFRFTSWIPAELNLKLLPDCLETAKIGTQTVDIRIWRKIADDIIGHIRDNLHDRRWGHHVILGIAQYDLQPLPNQTGGKGTFSGFPIDQEAEAKKIVQNAIVEAAEQLPKDCPGIVIVDTPFPMDDTFVQTTLSHIANPDQIKHIRAVILSFVFTVMSGKARYRLSLVNNPHSDYKNEDLSLIRDVLSLGTHDLEDAFFSALQNGSEFDSSSNKQ